VLPDHPMAMLVIPAISLGLPTLAKHNQKASRVLAASGGIGVTRQDKEKIKGGHPVGKNVEQPSMNILRVNPATAEVFLHLYENITITPDPEKNTAGIVSILNGTRIRNFLLVPPLPYRNHHAVGWLRRRKEGSDKFLEDLRGGKAVTYEYPMQAIRKVQPDGTKLFLGDVSVSKNGRVGVEDESLRTRMTKENLGEPLAQAPRQEDHARSSLCGNQLASGCR